MALTRRVAAFAEVEGELVERAHRMVWCNVATVGTNGRPRSRVLHPVWADGTGWVGTRRRSPKARDIAHSPYVSMAYVSDLVKPAYAECRAEWVDGLAERKRIWDLFVAAPAPLGYDPAPIFGTIEGFGLLKLTPWRVWLPGPSGEALIWEER